MSSLPRYLLAACVVALVAVTLAACELVHGDPSDGSVVDVPFHRLHGFAIHYNSTSPTLVFRTEAEWKEAAGPADSRYTPPTPNFEDSLVLAVVYGEVPANQTGGEIASVERRGDHVVVRASQRVQRHPIAMADVFNESFVQVAKTDVGEQAEFTFDVPADVDTVYTQP